MAATDSVLVVGAGQIGRPLAAHLAQDHDVWCASRFSQPQVRDELQQRGVTTVQIDLATDTLGGLPDDFDLVIHLAAFQSRGTNFDWALKVNGEGTGLVMRHCRRAKAVLIASSVAVYRAHPNPLHPFKESDALGEVHQPHAETYCVSKIASEAVGRFCARAFELPTTIARLNAVYGESGGLPAMHLDAILGGRPIEVGPGPVAFSPICQDDLHLQVKGLLRAASVPATIVNWGGDDVVTVHQWCRYLGQMVGRAPQFGLEGIGMPSRV